MAVTAFPVIKIDSTAGAASDTLCSGAGPSTALSGTTNATVTGGTTVTLPPGTNLSGVATDGSHAIYFHDTTAGARRFAAINATAGSGGATPTVTVEQALANVANKTWGIGGVRASLFGANSVVLVDNNSALGDWVSGWTAEFQSGHTETWGGISSGQIRCPGVNTNGPVTICGVAGAATQPILTQNVDGIGFRVRTTASDCFAVIKNFEIKCSGGHTASIAFDFFNSSVLVEAIKCTASGTNSYWKFTDGGGGGITFRSCEVANTASHGFDIAGDSEPSFIINNYIHDCGGHGIFYDQGGGGGLGGRTIYGNIIYNNATDGIHISNVNASDNINRGGYFIAHNTIASNGSDGIEVDFFDDRLSSMQIFNNIICNHASGFGVKFSGGSATAAMLAAMLLFLDSNDIYNNASGYTSPSGLATNNPDLNPTFPGSGDFSIDSALKALGFPKGGTLKVGTTSNSNSYVDPGAVQRVEPTGGSGTVLFVVTE